MNLKKEFKTFVINKIAIGCFIGILIIMLFGGGAVYQYNNRVPDGYIRINDEDHYKINDSDDIDYNKQLMFSISEYIFQHANEITSEDIDNKENDIIEIRNYDEESNNYTFISKNENNNNNNNNNNYIYLSMEKIDNEFICNVEYNDNKVISTDNGNNRAKLDISNITDTINKYDIKYIDDNPYTDEYKYAEYIYNNYKELGVTELWNEDRTESVEMNIENIYNSIHGHRH